METLRRAKALRWFGAGKCLVEEIGTGETWLASRLVPGEVAEVRSFGEGFRRQHVAERIEVAAPGRIEPECVHYDEGCTGCSLLHVDDGTERAYKKQLVSEVLERFASVTWPADAVGWIGPEGRWHHRTRATLRLGVGNDGRVRLGLGGWDGEVVHTPSCRVLAPALGQMVKALAEAFCATLPADAAEGSLHLNQQGAAVQLRWQDGPADGVERLGTWLSQAVGLSLPPVEVVDSATDPAWSQTAPERAQELYAWVQRVADTPGGRVLDATCGTGGMSVLLAQRAVQVIGVDRVWEAVQAAQQRAAGQCVTNAEFRGGAIETVFPRLLREGHTFDTVLFNPMRESLGDDVMACAVASGAGRVVYIAPAPRAGAEDIGALVRAGFAVVEVVAIDMHPGTAQVLMGVVLRR